MEDNELKPCPFCGTASPEQRFNTYDELTPHYLSCHKCGAAGPGAYSRKTAVMLWNQRGDPDKPIRDRLTHGARLLIERGTYDQDHAMQVLGGAMMLLQATEGK